MNRGLGDIALYRARQFFAAISAGHLSAADRDLLETYLAPAQQALFERMPENDQQHALAVARTLIDQDWRSADLIQAALLHDVGKIDGGLNLAYRVAIVLLRALWPAGLERLAVDSGWRRPFYVYRHHPQRGAELAAEAGSSARVAELILRHQSPLGEQDNTEALAALQAADERH